MKWLTFRDMPTYGELELIKDAIQRNYEYKPKRKKKAQNGRRKK